MEHKDRREIKIEVEGAATLETVEQAIHEKLATEPTDLFAQNDTVILVLQHHVAGSS